MRRALCVLLALLLAGMPALATEWSAERRIECAENRASCRLLQTVMAGAFDDCDPADALSTRVLSASRPLLSAVTDDDLEHFAGEFGEDAEAVRLRLYAALRNCLWAELRSERLPEGRAGSADRVLLLFIDPASQPDAQAQIDRIRAAMTDEALQTVADAAEVPAGFVRWLIAE